MKLTKNIDADIAAFEQERGVKLKPKVVRLIKMMAVAGDYFDDLGAKDASSGRARRAKEVFIEWGKRELGDPEGKDCPIVDLMYDCYLDGYKAGKEVPANG